MSRARDFADLAGSADAGGLTGRNVLINGAMTVSQRGTSQTGITGNGYFQAPDRWRFEVNSAGTWSVSQSTTAPDGFSNSYKIDCTTADASLAAGDYVLFMQRLEGQDLQHLKKGTASAESVTISFWVRSAKTGTYIVELDDNDNARNINKSFTISAANTWEHKTITFAGDTTGAFDNDNNASLRVIFWLAAGSNFTTGTLATSWEATNNVDRAVGNVNLADSASNDWYITGVQLEVGEQATPFEHRSFGEELALCQRYYEKSYSSTTNPGTATVNGIRHSSGAAGQTTTGELPMGINFLTTKRSAPTITLYDSQGNSGKCSRVDFGITTHANSTASSNFIGENAFMMSSSSGSTGSGVHCHFVADAEL